MAKTQIARKVQTCTSCGKQIPIGTKYWYAYNEGDDSHIKEHLNCAEHESKLTAQIKKVKNGN